MKEAGDRRWLLHLGIAIGVGAVLWIGDIATGRHLALALNSLAVKLAFWYEDNRVPTVLCSPGKAVPYTALAGVEFEIPQCWHTETMSLLDREVHRFFDPDARAGTVSISVDPIQGEEDLKALRTEFEALASRPPEGDEDEETDEPESKEPEAGVRVHSTADSLAERFSDGQDAGQEAGPGAHAPAPAPASGSAPAPAPAPVSAALFRTVETVGELGPAGEPAAEPSGDPDTTRPTEGDGPRRAWSWLMLSDSRAVRIVYAVREDWVGEPAVTAELKRVRTLLASVHSTP